MNENTIDNLFNNYLLELKKEEENPNNAVKVSNRKKSYFLDNSKELFDYFEAKQNIELNKNPTQMLNNFFFKGTNDDELNKLNSSIKTYIRKNNFTNSNFNDYIYDEFKCTKCPTGEMIKVQHEGLILCNKCFNSQVFFVDNDKPTYKEPPKEISFYAYKRINHFREVLSQVQAKEATDIPLEIINNIKNQIKKERLELSDMSYKKTKEILKKLHYNKYYEHISFIKDILGIKPPVMSPTLEDTLCSLFMNIQIPYSKFCPKDRVNFLNYYYTLYKLCELLDENQYLPFFPMLKEQKKKEQDDIWKKICNELNWQFIPTH